MSANAATPRRSLAIAGMLVGLVVLWLALGVGLILGCLIATHDPVASTRAVTAFVVTVAIVVDLLWMARIIRMLSWGRS